MPSTIHRHRALFIAPYPELARVTKEAAQDFPELDVTIHEGDLSAGLAAALGSMEDDYDVVISRGGTAQLLEDEFSIPVFEVRISPADLYDCLLAYNPGGRRCAVIGFENVLRPLRDVANFSDFDLDMYGVEFEDELPLALQQVQDGSYEVVLCDTFSLPRCLESGLDAHLLPSGVESVRAALGEALSFCQRAQDLLLRNHMLWNLVSSQDARFAVFAEDGRLSYCNLEQRRDELVEFARAHLDGRHDERLAVQRGSHLYRIHKVPVENDGRPCLVFVVERSRTPASSALVGIRRLNREDAAGHYHESVFAKSGASEALAARLVATAKETRPILLEGETGCGKESVAELLYLSGGWATRPLVRVDCPLLTDRSWNHLMDSPNSPLFDGEATLFFSSVQGLGEARMRQLSDVLERSGALGRDHVLLSLSGALASDGTLLSRIYERLRPRVVRVPPLRERPDIDRAVELLLNANCSAAGIPRPTLSDEAVSVLSAHEWPGNYGELGIVVQNCLAMAQDGRITADVAREAVAGTRNYVSSNASGTSGLPGIDLSRPLRDIERDVVSRVVERCGGNQTEAARSLGISRTTIWRLLREG